MPSQPHRDAVERALARARTHLRSAEVDLPEAVTRTVMVLAERGIWHTLSRNAQATSCREAAHRRVRLGHTGIPLWDELKSFFGAFSNQAGHRQYVVAHCRADRNLALDRLAVALQASGPVHRLDLEELSQLGMAYGLVNPFQDPRPPPLDGPLIGTPVLQVFDADLLEPTATPGTVMTNAGDLTWGIEVRPRELLELLDNTLAADIAEHDPDEARRPEAATHRSPIGIITGNAPESGAEVWRNLNIAVRAATGHHGGDVAMPPVVIDSLPELGLSMELDVREAEVWDALARSVQGMCRDGVRTIALACHTTSYFTPRIRAICAEFGAEFVSMPEVVAEWLRANAINEIALLGISFVANLDGPWSAYRVPLKGIHVEILDDRSLERLAELAYQVKSDGVGTSGLNQLRSFLDGKVHSKYVVLALTELSLLFESQRKPGQSERVLVDPLRLYGEELARRWVEPPIRR